MWNISIDRGCSFENLSIYYEGKTDRKRVIDHRERVLRIGDVLLVGLAGYFIGLNGLG